MNVNCSKTHPQKLARQGENNKTELTFTLPDGFTSVDYVNTEFERTDGNKLLLENLTLESGTVIVSLKRELTAAKRKVGKWPKAD